MAVSYVTYDFYTGVYLGTAIAETVFPRLALRASAMIDQITYGRASVVIAADDDQATIELIEMATCAIAEEIQTQEMNGNVDGLKSESVGSFSVSYGTNSAASLTNEEKQAKAARLYLAQTGLMYRGLNED